MIQFNLLPEVKLDYVKARRTKRVTMLISVLITGGALTVLVLLFMGVQVFQKKHLNDLSKDIETESSQLKSVENIDKILTVQNQLNSLTDLHNSKPVATRLFGFIRQLTPKEVSIASMKVDFENNTVDITGSAIAISSVNKFADTLKFTNYKVVDQDQPGGLAFFEVVLASFGKDTKGTSYQLTFKYDPIIFDVASNVQLEVPAGKITTRSLTEKPALTDDNSLFQPLSNPDEVQE